MPKRSISYLGLKAAIISISHALQAPVLKCIIQGDLILAQFTTLSSIIGHLLKSINIATKAVIKYIKGNAITWGGAVDITSETTCIIVKKNANGKNWL